MSSFSMNKVLIIGRLGNDPELKHTTAGTPVCNFSVATNSSYKHNDTWEERTEWHRIVIFGSLAENVVRNLRKGSVCFIEGRLQTRKYQDRNGIERSTTEIVAQIVKFMDSRPAQGNSYGERQYAPAEKSQPQPQPQPQQTEQQNSPEPSLPPISEEDDNLPF